MLTFLLSQVGRYFPASSVIDENALTIHYTKNTGNIALEEMVLVDAGGVGIHLRLGLTYLSFTVDMSLTSLALGH